MHSWGDDWPAYLILGEENAQGQKGSNQAPQLQTVSTKSPLKPRPCSPYSTDIRALTVPPSTSRSEDMPWLRQWLSLGRMCRRAPQKPKVPNPRHRKSRLAWSQDYRSWKSTTHSITQELFLWLKPSYFSILYLSVLHWVFWGFEEVFSPSCSFLYLLFSFSLSMIFSSFYPSFPATVFYHCLFPFTL